MLRRIVALVACGARVASAQAAPGPSALHVPDTARFSITIRPIVTDTSAFLALELEIPRTTSATTTLQLPNEWAGRSNLYRNVVGLEAVSPNATLRPGTDSSHVQVQAPVGRPLIIRWRLHETPPSSARDAHNHSGIGRDWAQLIGYDALVLPVLENAAPVRVTFRVAGVPAPLVFATSFGAARSNDSLVTARGVYGELRHAVYTFGYHPGALRAYALATPGGALTLVVRGRLAIPDTSIGTAVQRVVAAERAFWGGPHPRNYLVTVGVASRGTLAGTRLTNAFIADIDSTHPMDEPVSALFAHELMHEWFGGRFRPATGVRDGSLAWFMEGFTDYMTHRILWRASLLSDSAYLETINTVLAEHALSPARDSSWAAVVQGFWQNAALQREPYLRGELLALRLDGDARTAPATGRSVENALLALSRSGQQLANGLTELTIRRALTAGLGPFVNAEIDRAIHGGPIALQTDAFGACATSAVETRARWDPGFDVDSSLLLKRVVGTRTNGPAATAGVRDGQAITRTSIWHNNPAKRLTLGVATADGEQLISFMPASKDLVEIQRFVPTGAACASPSSRVERSPR